MSEAGGEEIPESVAEDTRSPPEQKAEGAEVSRGELKDEAGVAQSTESEDVGQKPTEIEATQPLSPEGGGATTKAHEKDGSSGADAGQEAESEVETGPKDADPMGMVLEGAERKSGKGDDPTADATEAAATTTTFKKPSFPAARTTTKTAAVAAAAPATPTAAANVSTASTAESDSSPSAEYAEHIAYTADGDAIYTDPQTQHQYKWCPKQNNWIYWQPTTDANTTSATAGGANPYENEHYRWCSERNQWIPKARKPGTTLTQSPTETEHYRWDAEKHAWIPKVQQQPQQQQQQQQQAQTATARATGDSNGDGEAASGRREDVTYGIDEDGQRIYTDRDGAVFFWDAAKSAWFPKIDDDFMARYQMNYGFIDNTSAGEAEKRAREEAEAKRKALELQQMAEEARAATEAAAAASAAGGGHVVGGKRKAPPEPPKWFELNPEQNTKVYVSNLPLDITLDEFAEVMSKCGLIMRDPQTQKYKLKLYTEADGQIKGDGLCDYIKVESVELALKILDEYEVRGHKIRVQRAQFQMRGEYNPALKPKRKKKDKEKLQKMKEKLFDWRPEKMRGERSKNEKVVIIKNLFTPETFEKEVQLILDYQNDLREECAKCGTVRKVVIYDLHAEGVAQVNMSSPEEADLVIQMMHGRFFGQRQLTAEHWDGKTKYKIAETETAVKSRLSNWDQFLETDEDRQADEAGPTDSTEQVK